MKKPPASPIVVRGLSLLCCALAALVLLPAVNARGQELEAPTRYTRGAGA